MQNTRLKEVCIEQARIGKGYCPIITRHNYLDWALCNTTGCPNDTYTSDEVYKYPICFMTTHTGPIRTTSNGMGTNLQSLIIVGIAIFILPILAYAFCAYLRRSQNRRCTGGLCISLSIFCFLLFSISDIYEGYCMPCFLMNME